MYNDELAKSTKFHLQQEKNLQQFFVWGICKANVSHLIGWKHCCIVGLVELK